MSEFIEREEVNALIKAECSPKVAAYLNHAIDNIPAADVRPVVRGKWIEQKDHTLMCSECLSEAPYQDDGYYGYVTVAPRFDYCPNCGALMEES